MQVKSDAPSALALAANWTLLANMDEYWIPAEAIYEDTGAGEYLIILPILVLFGLLGNFASLITILNTKLRKASRRLCASAANLRASVGCKSVFARAHDVGQRFSHRHGHDYLQSRL